MSTQEKQIQPNEFMRPEDIERESFRIIRQGIVARKLKLPEEEIPVTGRVIHTTADFEYAKTLYYSEHAVRVLHELLVKGTRIVTDTNMAKAGINAKKVEEMGGEVLCYMADPEVEKEAKERDVTRAMVSMERAAKLEGDTIFVVGNAPTALLKLRDLMNDGYKPAFIVGVPVGFVNVVYAKEEVMREAEERKIPYIINTGRKGGSNVAAAIINAAMYIEPEKEEKE